MSPSSVINSFLALVLLSLTSDPIFVEATTSLKSYYSPIVRLEADKGYFLITTNSGIQWIQVEDAVKEHLKTLEVGDMIDVVVELRPDPVPPLLKSWKLARSGSPCKVLKDQTCRKE